MKRTASFLLITLCIGIIHAQSYSDAFDQAFRIDDIAGQRQALDLWQQSAPEDVNLFIARYNFYANRAMGETPAETVPQLADSALRAITDGIRVFPDRLDLRFGKIYFLGQIADWDAFVAEIDSTLNHSMRIAHKWTFPNVPEDMIEGLIVEGMADYMVEMFVRIADTAHLTDADKVMAKRIQRVAKRTVQLFPGDFPSTYMLALSHLMLNEYDKAYKYLMRAERIDNNSIPMLKSLVQVCRALGKDVQASEYQQRINYLQGE